MWIHREFFIWKKETSLFLTNFFLFFVSNRIESYNKRNIFATYNIDHAH